MREEKKLVLRSVLSADVEAISPLSIVVCLTERRIYVGDIKRIEIELCDWNLLMRSNKCLTSFSLFLTAVRRPDGYSTRLDEQRTTSSGET